MKNIVKYTLLVLVSIILVTSCKKDTTAAPTEEPIIETTFNNANAKALLNNLATPLQTYTVNTSSYHTFICTNGTIIRISPYAFLTQSGGSVAGVVTIEAKDVLSKKDMILNNAIPVSNGRLLVSGGEVYLNATQGGQKLKINPSSAVYIQVPSMSPSSQMREFYASGGSNLSNTNLNWVTDTSSTATNTIAVIQDTTGTGGSGYYYSFQSDSLNWSNCDYFNIMPGAKTTCTVNLTGAFNNSNTVVFLSMNGVTTLAHLNSSYSGISQKFESYINSIPEAVNYTVIAISFDGTNYYYVSQSITMITDMVINLPALTQTTKTQIETNLSALP